MAVSQEFQDRVDTMFAQRKEQDRLSDLAGEVKIQGAISKMVWRIGVADCRSVAECVREGGTFRPGGFRDTIRLLMLAGF